MSSLASCALLCLIPVAAVAAPEMLARDWGAAIPLRTVTVVSADTAASERLSAALRQAGASVRTAGPQEALAPGGLRWTPQVAATTVVLLGGVHTNPALMPLYGAYLSLGDAAYPGGEGYVIRTVARPFGAGTAALALEAGTPAGQAAAVARFTQLLAKATGGSFPCTLEAHLSPERLQAAHAGYDPGIRYLLTGEAEAGAQGVGNLLALADPQTGFARFGDYGIERYVREFGHLQDAPGVTAEDCRKLDQALLQTLLATEHEWWRWRDGSAIGGRHQTMGTSCFTAGVHLLLRRGNPNPEARSLLERWWSECQAYWKNACSTFHDDLEGIPVYYCPEPTLDWALMMGFDGYLRDYVPQVALRAYSVVDSLGYYAGTGTYEECRPGDLFKPVPWGWILQAASFFHPSDGFDWLQQNLPNTGPGTWGVARNFAGARNFAVPSLHSRPDRLLGITSVPLGPYRYAQLSHNRDEARAKGQRYLAAPADRCFEKLCFRDGFGLSDQYFVLEGFQAAAADNQPPMDANSLIRYTDLGHIWLHANTEKAGDFWRNALFCSDGINDSPQPAGCELQALFSGARVGLAASALRDCNACDWTRGILWRRGRYFVVIDLATQTREGRFGLTCTFRTPRRAWLTEDGMLAREGRAQMRVRNADAVSLALEGGHELEGAAVPTLLRETQPLDQGKGSLRAFRNLVYAADPEHPAELEVRPVGLSAVMVRGQARGEAELALLAAAPQGEGIRVGEVASDGQLLYLGAAGWAQAGGTGVTVAGQAFRGSEGEATGALRAALERLWAQTRPTSRPPLSPLSVMTPAPVWQCEPFTFLAPPAAAPDLTSQPQAQGMVGTLFDGVVERYPTVTWPGGQTITLALDLREARPIVQIDFQTGLVGQYNTIPDPATYPAPRRVTADFSNDGFAQDVGRRELLFTSDCTFENQHKGSVWPTLRWTCREGLGQSARQVRLIFGEDWKAGLGMSELCVRQQGPSWARILGLLQRDVTGPGAADILTWSDQAEVALLSAGGRPLWRKRFPGYVTAVECYPELAADGARILVTTREARLYCLKPDGTEAWKTDFLASAQLNGDIPIAYSIGLLKRPDGTPLIVTGNYNLATFVSPQGKVLKYERLPGAFQTMTLSRGRDLDGDGREETISTEVWGCLSVLDTDLRCKAGGRLPRGRGVLLDYWPQSGSGREPQGGPGRQPRVTVCTETGVGLLNPKTLQYEWLHPAQPINDCVVADLDGDGAQEVVVAKADGYLLVYDEAGKLKQSVLVGQGIRSLAAVTTPGGKTRLVAALPGRLVTFAPGLSDPATLAFGEYERLQAGRQPGRVLACKEGAVVEAIPVAE